MENSYKYFSNTACRYFPCHETEREDFNCLFCFCPLYALGRDCGGNFTYLENGVKSCENCILPHIPENYDLILERSVKLVSAASSALEG